MTAHHVNAPAPPRVSSRERRRVVVEYLATARDALRVAQTHLEAIDSDQCRRAATDAAVAAAAVARLVEHMEA